MEEEKIIIRTIITMIGKPKEHLDKILKDYVEELKKTYPEAAPYVAFIGDSKDNPDVMRI